MQRVYLYEAIDLLGSPYDSFIFDTDLYQLPVKPHWHYFIEFLYIIEGAVRLECDNDIYYLKAGDMILIYPQLIHSIYADTDEHTRYYVLKFDLNRLDMDNSSIPRFRNLFDNARHNHNIPFILHKELTNSTILAEYFVTCIEEMNQKNYGYDLLVRSSIYSILAIIVRYWRRYGFDFRNTRSIDTDVYSLNNILEYIDNHAGEQLRVEDLAKMCNISYSFFAKKFRELYGRSCKEYIEYVRISKAENLLLFSKNDLSSISQESGFSDCSHFIKVFKKWKGITPKQYLLNFENKGIKKEADLVSHHELTL